MDDQSENVRKEFDVNKHLTENIWENKEKGLRKEVIDFNFVSVVKPCELSKCLVEILDIINFDCATHKSNYLSNASTGTDFWINIGHSLTPVDCYIEKFLQQMFINETSKCQISTKTSGTIALVMKLKNIEFGGHYCDQKPEKMFELANFYKENGVKIFKHYPMFAHHYFCLAAKCLISITGEHIEKSLCNTELTEKGVYELLEVIYLNIAACLLKQKRYDDVLHVLKYSVNQRSPSEKAVYRLASAYFHLKQFENARKTIEKVDFKGNKELVRLMAMIQEFWKVDHDKYSNMVKKMFN
jgi:BDBT FKBP like N-terminal/Anaphase-promoting complex, cyclosome, subunit 3